jgi:hypothetical protein
MKKVILMILGIALGVIGYVGYPLFFTERDFFVEMPEKKYIGRDYYFYLSKRPSMFDILKYGYKYEYQLPGVYSKGYLMFEDSIIYEVGEEKGRDYKLPMFYFRKKENLRDKNSGEIIPSFTYLDSDQYGNSFQHFEPANFSLIPEVDFIKYKISFKKGILGMEIHYYDGRKERIGVYP